MIGDETKLPKLAQHKLRHMQDLVERAEAKAASAFGEYPTAIEIDTRCREEGAPRTFVPDGTDIRFQVDGEVIEVYLRDGGVAVMARGAAIAISPASSSNVVIARPIEWKSVR